MRHCRVSWVGQLGWSWDGSCRAGLSTGSDRRRAQAQTIDTTTVIVVNTDPANPLLDVVVDSNLVGGGTDNIAFLRGDQTGTAGGG